MDIGTAINRIAERAYDSRELMGQSLRQRRTEFTDIYGIPYYSEIDSDKTFQCHIGMPFDLEYYMRFQFQLIVNTDYEIDPDRFYFYMTDAETYDQGAYDGEDYLWVDLSPYLIEQTADDWVNGAGYFPSDGSNENDYYDILEACSLLVAEGKEEIKDMLLRNGNKIIKIKSPVKANIIFKPYFKADNFGC